MFDMSLTYAFVAHIPGRTYGNLGNTHYLLCNFQLAIQNHEKRLEIALTTKDIQAERRAHTNLGNSNIFLG